MPLHSRGANRIRSRVTDAQPTKWQVAWDGLLRERGVATRWGDPAFRDSFLSFSQDEDGLIEACLRILPDGDVLADRFITVYASLRPAGSTLPSDDELIGNVTAMFEAVERILGPHGAPSMRVHSVELGTLSDIMASPFADLMSWCDARCYDSDDSEWRDAYIEIASALLTLMNNDRSAFVLWPYVARCLRIEAERDPFELMPRILEACEVVGERALGEIVVVRKPIEH